MTGTREDYDDNVNEAIKLNDANLHLKIRECSFKKDSVQYLGHKASGEGIAPVPDKF